MRQAPDLPSTEQLHHIYPLTNAARLFVQQTRREWSHIIDNPEAGLIDIDGGCGITVPERHIIVPEGARVMRAEGGNGHMKGYRANPYKPRTKSTDWHGTETTEPEETYEMLNTLANNKTALVMEVAYPYHIARYGRLLAAAWTGGRNAHNPGLIDELAMLDITLPLFIKNGLDGVIHTALEHVERTSNMRAKLAYKLGIVAAPVILAYRGGENAQTPEAWEDAYIKAHELTGGRLVLDTAHGTEMAHHPAGEFKKSVPGQEIAQEHLIELTERGYAPAIKLSEASSAKGWTDPNMPLERSIINGKRLFYAKMAGQFALAA